MSRPRRVAIVGGARFGFAEPYAGGMESHTADLTFGLRARGYQVAVFSGRNTADNVGSTPIWDNWRPAAHSRSDMSVDPHEVIGEHMAYQTTMLRLARAVQRGELDHVHLNSCHHLPIAMAPFLGIPVTATLHSPPTDWLIAAYEQAGLEGGAPTPVAVSASLAKDYAEAAGWSPAVIENGINLDTFAVGDGKGGYVAWCGRLVAEKAPHLAIDAAVAAGLPIQLAGPSHDKGFFDREIAPRLGPTVSYLGHLDRRALASMIGAAAACLVTPAWPEPFGLAAIEAMACGTPVAAIGLGALPNLVDDEVGVISAATVPALAEAITVAITRNRADVRHRAEQRFGVDRMLDSYADLLERAQVAAPVHLEPVA